MLQAAHSAAADRWARTARGWGGELFEPEPEGYTVVVGSGGEQVSQGPAEFPGRGRRLGGTGFRLGR